MTSTSSSENDLSSPYYRLARSHVPTHYKIDIQPIYERDTFLGSASITVKVAAALDSPVQQVVVHARGLLTPCEHITITIPQGEEQRTLQCSRVELFQASETMRMHFSEPLPNAEGDVYTIHISNYTGHIYDCNTSAGLFHSNSTDGVYLSTHCEPTDTRAIFPCWDEPFFHATFQLNIVVAEGLSVVSNTDVESEAHHVCSDKAMEAGACAETRLRCVSFRTTPPLHTCIIGFNIGRFSILESYSRKRSVLCRVVFPISDYENAGWFALDLLSKALDFFDDFFSYELPLQKIDLVALESFCALGMENYGMINLKKEFMLVDEMTSLERRQRITRLIGHEVCHHWFGNWACIEWWQYLWLKEGMCRYLEYVFVDSVYPSWCMWNGFLSSIFDPALLIDALPDRTHPVECCDSAPRKISQSFDQISYDKGAALLRMLFSIVDLQTLKKASHLLMQRFANRCFNSSDFFTCVYDALQHVDPCAAEKHVYVQSMAELVNRAGHPLVLVRASPHGYHVDQYVTPLPHRGILLAYLRHKNKQGGAPIDLMTPPVRERFEWEPANVLRRLSPPYRVAMRVLEVCPQCSTSPVRLLLLSENTTEFIPTNVVHSAAAAPSPGSSPEAAHSMCYFNFAGSGIFRCDYDLSTWRRVFELAPYLRHEDRMIVTMTLARNRNMNIGHFPGEKGERCTLFLEWLLIITQLPNTMNSFLWDYITCRAEELLYMVQNFYCQSIVSDFIASLYTPLQHRCLLSFFSQEKTGTFQSQVHLSVQNVMNILRVLALCGNENLIEEAEEVGTWALSALIPALHLGSSNPEVFQGAAMDRPHTPSHFPSMSTSLQQGAEVGPTNPLNSAIDVSRGHMFRSSKIDFTSPQQTAAATIALQLLVGRGQFDYWCQIASVMSAYLDVPLDETAAALNIEFPVVQLDEQLRQEKYHVIGTLASAFFSLENEKAFPFMGSVFCTHSTGFAASLYRSLYRNTRFLTYLLEERLVPTPALHTLIMRGTDFCSNGHLITMLKASLVKANTSAESLGEYKSLNMLSGYYQESPATNYRLREQDDTKPILPQIAKALDIMECNCVWMDYACVHLEQFLSEKKQKKAWLPNRSCTASSHMLSTPRDGGDLSTSVDDKTACVSI